MIYDGLLILASFITSQAFIFHADKMVNYTKCNALRQENLLVIWTILVPLGHVFTHSMIIATRSTSINGTVFSIEASLAHAGPIDTLSVFFASLITGPQITSGTLPSRITDAGGSQTLTMRTTVKAANSLGRKVKDVCCGQKNFWFLGSFTDDGWQARSY